MVKKEVLYFTADWCGPCQKIKPVFHELKEAHPNIKFSMIDVDKEENADLATKHKVEGIPAFFFLVDSVVQHKFVGAEAKRLRENVEVLNNL
jgi:thiol-disulfide isomerase/thioredoxin